MTKLLAWLFGPRTPRHHHTWTVTGTMGAGWSAIYTCDECGKVDIG